MYSEELYTVYAKKIDDKKVFMSGTSSTMVMTACESQQRQYEFAGDLQEQ